MLATPHPHHQPCFTFFYSPVSSDFGKQSRREQERWEFSEYLTPYWPFSHASCETSLKKKKLPFFSSLPSDKMPLSPSTIRGETMASLSVPMKRGSHPGCGRRPAVTAPGHCQGPRRDSSGCSSSDWSWHSQMEEPELWFAAGRHTYRPGILLGTTRFSSPQDDTWCASLLLEAHRLHSVFLSLVVSSGQLGALT